MRQQAQIRLGPVAHRDQPLPLVAHQGRKFCTLGITKVDHRRAIGGQKAAEKPRFRGKVGLERLVIIQMVLGKVGEARSL